MKRLISILLILFLLLTAFPVSAAATDIAPDNPAEAETPETETEAEAETPETETVYTDGTGYLKMSEEGTKTGVIWSDDKENAAADCFFVKG